MRKQIRSTLIFIILVIILFSCNRQNNKNSFSVKNSSNQKEIKQADKNEKIFNSLDSKEVLGKLYDNPIFDSNGVAIWTPNFEEKMHYHVSYDGKCHTTLDTIMYFVNSRGMKCAVAILSTYFNGSNNIDSTIGIGGDCHFCSFPIGVALFSQEDNGKWELYRFDKQLASLGYFGIYKTGREDAGKICLKEIGDKWTCLSLKEGVGGSSGASWGYEMFYNIEMFYLNTQRGEKDDIHEGWPTEKCMLCYNYLSSYYNEEEKKDNFSNTTEMKIIKKKKDYYDIDLIETKNGKKKVKHLYFSEIFSKFIEK